MFFLLRLARLLFKLFFFLLAAFLAFPGGDFRSDRPQPARPDSVPFVGRLAPNDRLDRAESLFEGLLSGPESYAARDGRLFTGVQGGHVISFDPARPEDGIERVTRVGRDCEGQHEEHICGRVLGLEFDPAGDLLVADAYYGLYKRKMATGELTPLVPSTRIIDGKPNLITNSLAVAKDGTIYFTSSSTWVALNSSMLEAMSLRPSGRLMRYDPSTDSVTVLVDNVPFANGVALSPDESFLVFAACGDLKVYKYSLAGAAAGRLKTFFDPPGIPDNVVASKDGFYVGLVSVDLPDKRYGPLQMLRKYLWLRKAMGNLAGNVIRAARVLHSVAPWSGWKKMEFWAANTESGIAMAQRYGLVVKLDLNGEVVDSFHAPKGKLAFICEGFPHDGWLYLGSPYPTLNHIARVRL